MDYDTQTTGLNTETNRVTKIVIDRKCFAKDAYIRLIRKYQKCILVSLMDNLRKSVVCKM